MTNRQASEFLQGRLNCMKKCGVFERQQKYEKDECEHCNYCYAQGNFGEQKDALAIAIMVLKRGKKK